MNDPDVIAHLFPAEGNGYRRATDVIYMEENDGLFVPPRPHQLDIFADRSVRAGTELPDDEDNNNIQEDGPCLKLRFSRPPKTRKGLVAGRCPDSDIVLPNLKGISWFHFTLTFDEENRLIVRDLGSTVGTRVLYGDEEDSTRGYMMDFSAHGPEILGGRPAVIKVLGNLRFKLVVPNHDTSSRAYLENVERFRQGTAATEDLFAALDLDLISRAQTELPTPSLDGLVPDREVPGAILWRRKIAKGGFATVYYAWDVTTRKEYAVKLPRPDKSFNRKIWLREANLLKDLRHDNIVELKHAILDDGPELYFEYLQKGSLLKYQRSATALQQEEVVFQILSALEYLHGLKVPIIHRDIKPENILVKEWSPHRVHVKLGDFGLSNQGKLLETFCGTAWYMAPEGYTKQTDAKYGPKVDIWSVGVLVVWLETGTCPEYLVHYQTDRMAWATAMVRFALARLRRCGSNELLSFAIDYMLVIHPADRRTARECLTKAELLMNEKPKSSPDSVYCDALDDNNSDESQPATPRAFSAPDDSNLTQDLNEASGASTIRPSLLESLAQRGSSAIDSILGIDPSNVAEFEADGSGAVTPDTVCGDTLGVSLLNGSLWNGSLWNRSLWNGSLWNGSLWNGSLWNGSLWNGSLWNGSVVNRGDIESVEDDEEKENSQPEQDHGADSQSFAALVGLLDNTGDDRNVVITEIHASSKVKRPWVWVDAEGEDVVALADNQSADGPGRKRSKVVA